MLRLDCGYGERARLGFGSRRGLAQALQALAAIKGDRTLVQLSEHFDVHVNQIMTWKAQLEGSAADVFGTGGSSPAEPVVDVKSLHAKIGELTLENDF